MPNIDDFLVMLSQRFYTLPQGAQAHILLIFKKKYGHLTQFSPAIIQQIQKDLDKWVKDPKGAPSVQDVMPYSDEDWDLPGGIFGAEAGLSHLDEDE